MLVHLQIIGYDIEVTEKLILKMSEFLTPQNDDSLIIAILSTFKIFLHRGVQKEYCDFWAGDWRYCRCYDDEFTYKEKYRLQEIFLNEYIEIFMIFYGKIFKEFYLLLLYEEKNLLKI